MRSFGVSLSLAACLVLLAPFASAALIDTPLVLEPDVQNPDVGDTVTITVSPKNESVIADHATKTYRVDYFYDAAEEGGASRSGRVGNVTLDASATGTFTWTIPPVVKDANVFVSVLDGEDAIGSVHIAVEDAPPVMFSTGGEAPPDAPPAGEIADGAGEASPDDSASAMDREVPFAGAVVLLLAVVAVAMLVKRRR